MRNRKRTGTSRRVTASCRAAGKASFLLLALLAQELLQVRGHRGNVTYDPLNTHLANVCITYAPQRSGWLMFILSHGCFHNQNLKLHLKP